MTDGLSVLFDHVERFNQGVRTGDFGRMLELFTDHAELVFEGVPVGPFRGKREIDAAYRDRPPDDQIELLTFHEGAGEVVAEYGWRRDRSTRAGELRLTLEDHLISRLVVTFDR